MRRDRAARPHRRPGATPGGPTGPRSASWSRTSTSRCSATATSGRPPTRSRMVEETGAAGVVVGRGCLGRPWLFRDLAAAFAGEEVATLPALGEVAAMMRRHAELLCQHMGEEQRLQGVPQARRVVPQGLRRRRRAAAQPGPGLLAGRARRAARPARPGRAVPGRRRSAPRADGRAARAGVVLPAGLARRHRRHRLRGRGGHALRGLSPTSDPGAGMSRTGAGKVGTCALP